MTGPTHVDGNAVGGLLDEVFGRDLTDAVGCCGHCGAIRVLATLRVYRAGSGDVIRCPVCDTVLVVMTPHPSGLRVHFSALAWLRSA